MFFFTRVFLDICWFLMFLFVMVCLLSCFISFWLSFVCSYVGLLWSVFFFMCWFECCICLRKWFVSRIWAKRELVNYCSWCDVHRVLLSFMLGFGSLARILCLGKWWYSVGLLQKWYTSSQGEGLVGHRRTSIWPKFSWDIWWCWGFCIRVLVKIVVLFWKLLYNILSDNF